MVKYSNNFLCKIIASKNQLEQKKLVGKAEFRTSNFKMT